MTGRKIRSGQSEFSPPENPRIGQLFYDSMTSTMRRWNGKDWTTEVRPGEISNKEGHDGDQR